MRAICGLFALLIMLGPIGMGIMLNVDSPYLEDDAFYSDSEAPSREEHGTRSEPTGSPTYLNFYIHSSGASMNTTTRIVIPYPTVQDATFTLQDPLIRDLLVEDPLGGYGMMAQLYLQGQGWISVDVFDGDGGPLIGSGSLGDILNQFDYSVATLVDIPIPFESGWGNNYIFNTDSQIVFEIDITGTGVLHYDHPERYSRLRLYCSPVTDITVGTYNFYNEATEQFYPEDIDFPVSRREIIMKGIVSDALGKNDNKYIKEVYVQFEGPGGYNETRKADWTRSIAEYSYTWKYPKNQTSGEYLLTAHVYDEQDNEFLVESTFNMSEYGVLLTSPSQTPDEGTYKGNALRNLAQHSITTYDINIHNIGNNDTIVDLQTSSLIGWDWWISGENLAVDNNKSGTTKSIPSGDYLGIKFSVDAKDNPLEAWATLIITAKSTDDLMEVNTLTTISTIVPQFDVKMEFKDTSLKQLNKKVETGDSINVGFIVTNNGGEDDTIYIDLSSAPAGWSISLSGPDLEGSQSQYWVFLYARQPTDELTLTINTPQDQGEEEVDIDITGWSDGSADQGDDPIVSDKISVNVETTTGLSFKLDDKIEKKVDPDDDVAFEFIIENTGTSPANFSVTFSGLPSSDGWETGDASFDPSGFEFQKDFFNLAPNNPQPFSLFIEPTLDVMAGNYTIQIHAENIQAPTSKFANQLIYCRVNEFYNMEIVEPISLEDSADAEPGDDVEYTIIIENNGNVAERVSVSVDKPGDWKLDFGNVSEDWIMDIEPGETETIPIVLTVPKDAQGDETVEITITIVPSNSDIIQVVTFTTIKQNWFQPFLTLLVPLLLFIVILVMVIVIYKRR